MTAAKDDSKMAKKQIESLTNEKKSIESHACKIKEDLEEAGRNLMEVTADRDRFKQQLDLTQNDKQNLDRVRSSQAKQIDELGSEIEKLKLANADLQRTRDHLEDEREATGMSSFLWSNVIIR